MLKSYLLVSVHMTLFGSRIFADTLHMRPYWFRVGTHKVTTVSIRERRGRFVHRDKEEIQRAGDRGKENGLRD